MPKISVVIPAYNAELTIKETIESVQKQTFADFELIIINDGSTDGTLEKLQSVDDSRLKIFSYQNGGLSVARNRGVVHATGEFIAFLDADDLWAPDKLELQLVALEQHPEAGVAYSWTYFMNEKENCLFPGSRSFYEGNVYKHLLIKNFIANGSNPLIRRAAIESVGGFDPELSHFADWDYWLRIAHNWSFVVIPKYQIYYRQSSRTMSSRVDGIQEAGYILIEKAFRSAPKELQSLKKIAHSMLLLYCTDLYLQHSTDISGIKKSGENLWTAIRLHPQSLLTKETQKLVTRFIFIRLFTPHVASYLLQFFRRIRNISQYQLQR
jgi:glycosyltransferase involved in cell wall biosynthesis